jgi:hypothetical protein
MEIIDVKTASQKHRLNHKLIQLKSTLGTKPFVNQDDFREKKEPEYIRQSKSIFFRNIRT